MLHVPGAHTGKVDALAPRHTTGGGIQGIQFVAHRSAVFGHEEDVVRRGVVDRRTRDAERIDVAALPLLSWRR
jgi:hypothetical protein